MGDTFARTESLFLLFQQEATNNTSWYTCVSPACSAENVSKLHSVRLYVLRIYFGRGELFQSRMSSVQIQSETGWLNHRGDVQRSKVSFPAG